MALKEKISDISIIGAGPAGLLAGYEINPFSRGINVAIQTKNSTIGHPAHCSGLISYRGLQKLGLSLKDLEKEIGYNKIHRAKFIGPSNNSFEINRGSNSMVVLDRTSFDQYLARRAQKNGCEIHTNNRVRQIRFDNNSWSLRTDINGKKVIYKSKILINTEGIHAHLANSIGFPVPDKKWIFPAFQGNFTNIRDFEIDCTELYFGQKLAPGFFGWFIPLNDESARVGLAICPWMGRNLRNLFQNFTSKHPVLKKRLKASKITRSYGGFVPVTGPISKTYNRNYMVAGDAAGQTKATTGGGVNIGGFCGRLAGKHARRIIEGEIGVKEGCKEYESQWKAHLMPDILFMKYFRRSMTHFSDKTWTRVINIAAKTDIQTNLKNTDIDLHGTGLFKYALKPPVFKQGILLLPSMVTNLLRGLLV